MARYRRGMRVPSGRTASAAGKQIVCPRGSLALGYSIALSRVNAGNAGKPSSNTPACLILAPRRGEKSKNVQGPGKPEQFGQDEREQQHVEKPAPLHPGAYSPPEFQEMKKERPGRARRRIPARQVEDTN